MNTNDKKEVPGRNQIYRVNTVCNTTLTVVAHSTERCKELVTKAGYKVGTISRVGNAHRSTPEGICE